MLGGSNLRTIHGLLGLSLRLGDWGPRIHRAGEFLGVPNLEGILSLPNKTLKNRGQEANMSKTESVFL